MLEKGNSKTKFFWGKGEVFLEFYSLLLFLLHVGNKGKAREVLPKVLEKLLWKPGKDWEGQKLFYVKQKELRLGSNISLHHCWCRACLLLLHRCHQDKNLTTFKSKRGMGIHSGMCGMTIDIESLGFEHFFVSRKQGHWKSKISFSATKVVYTVQPNSQSSYKLEKY